MSELFFIFAINSLSNEKFSININYIIDNWSLSSQEIGFKLKSGNFSIQPNLNSNILDEGDYRMFFFSDIPNKSEKLEMENEGVDFLYYLPQNIFVVYLNNNISSEKLEEYNINSCNEILPEYKIDNKLKQEEFPEWSVSDDLLHLKLILFKNVKISEVIDDLKIYIAINR